MPSTLANQINEESTTQMIKTLCIVSVPVIISAFCTLLIEFLNVIFAGHMGNNAKVAGVGLGNVFVNMLC
jgi:Na+-driven multidrug efflux pump